MLVMDEAVSNLDAAGEQEVTRAMDVARHVRTTLVIAHRLSTILTVDRIAVISGGRVAESGTHEELLALDSAYVELLASQFDGFAGPGARLVALMPVRTGRAGHRRNHLLKMSVIIV